MEDTLNSEAGTLVFLPEPTVPSAETNGGIGFEDVEDNAKGVWVRVGPWFNMHAGDSIRVFWDNPDLAAVTHTVGDEKEAILLAIPAERIKEGPAQQEVDVWYSVRLFPSDEESESARIPVLVDLTIPGDRDPLPSTPENDNLEPVVGLPPVIGQGQAVTITVPRWLNQEPGDVLTIAWGSYRRKLQPLTALGDVAVNFTAAEIAQGGDGNVPITYEIRDRVNNWSRWSKAATAQVEIGDRLPPPEFIDDNTGQGVIDLADLAGGSTQIRARYTVSGARVALGDHVIFTWIGQTAEGKDLPPVIMSKDVAAPVPAFVRFDVPYDDVAVCAGGNATAQYHVAPGGIGTPKPSARAIVRIVGDIQRLTPPTVSEAVGGTLDPVNVPTGATVRIDKYPFIATGDRITYEMLGQAPGGVVVGDQGIRDIGNIDNPIVFITPVEKINALAGGSADFFYRVDTFTTGDDGAVSMAPKRMIAPDGTVVSPVLTLKIAGAANTLPPPTVPAAEGDILDPSKVNDALGVQVDASWPAIAPGDLVTITWRGSIETAPVTDTLPYRSGGKVSTYVPKKHVMANDGGTVDLNYTVVYASGGTGASQHLMLNIGSAQLDLPPPTVDGASNGQLDPFGATQGLTVRIPANASIKTNDAVTVTWKDKDDPVGQRGSHMTASQPGNPGGMAFTVPASVLAFNFGEQVEVTYTVERNGRRYTSSTLGLGKLPLNDNLPPGYRKLRDAENTHSTVSGADVAVEGHGPIPPT
jgi:hypothetical protein